MAKNSKKICPVHHINVTARKLCVLHTTQSAASYYMITPFIVTFQYKSTISAHGVSVLPQGTELTQTNGKIIVHSAFFGIIDHTSYKGQTDRTNMTIIVHLATLSESDHQREEKIACTAYTNCFVVFTFTFSMFCSVLLIFVSIFLSKRHFVNFMYFLLR